MKKVSILTSLVLSAIVSLPASAECTRDAWKMGWTGAQFTCNELVNGWAARQPTRPRSCSFQDVVDCKRAMASYLEETHEGYVCKGLIDQKAPIYDDNGNFIGTADRLWIQTQKHICNM
ncbi:MULTISPECIES: hypothetical protein [Zooshikella]|uniref:DUF3012 domain-containing protein n=1 Tax=Zooshikella harenae TaxID=2827238 RepID=A0ABS5ZED3_9GAMM|nr:hypothetical protein [Zooshikella harenae]MBU2712330.1 hypothetical protein [Zooshikella harenae]